MGRVVTYLVFFDNFLQPSTTEISRLITVKENIVSGSMWSILFHHIFDSNFYNVFSYSYDDYLSGKSIYDVENRFKNAHLYYHNFYDVFTYSYDDQKTYHHSWPLDQWLAPCIKFYKMGSVNIYSKMISSMKSLNDILVMNMTTILFMFYLLDLYLSLYVGPVKTDQYWLFYSQETRYCVY